MDFGYDIGIFISPFFFLGYFWFLDSNEAAYREKYQTPLFKNGRLPDAFDLQVIKTKIDEKLSNI
jgi:hypothetical protein